MIGVVASIVLGMALASDSSSKQPILAVEIGQWNDGTRLIRVLDEHFWNKHIHRIPWGTKAVTLKQKSVNRWRAETIIGVYSLEKNKDGTPVWRFYEDNDYWLVGAPESEEKQIAKEYAKLENAVFIPGIRNNTRWIHIPYRTSQVFALISKSGILRALVLVIKPPERSEHLHVQMMIPSKNTNGQVAFTADFLLGNLPWSPHADFNTRAYNDQFVSPSDSYLEAAALLDAPSPLLLADIDFVEWAQKQKLTFLT